MFNKIIDKHDDLLVENICQIYQAANDFVYQSNAILPCPKQLFNVVKTEILKLKEAKNYSQSKINIKACLTDAFIKQQKDTNLTKTLFKLFQNHDNAYFNVQIAGDANYFFDMQGEFKLPKGFTENLYPVDTLHYSFPRIKPLLLDNEIIKKFQTTFKNDSKLLKSMYEKQQKAIEVFKNDILNFNDFGTIVIYPWNCTYDETNLNMPTLDEVIQHQCQHLCIFLLSLAKTCINVGLHFSNNLKQNVLTYQLKASQFITLTGSYCNILARIFKTIDEPKNLNDFVKTVLDLSLFESTKQNEKYINALNSSQQFQKIKKFFKLIFKDSKYGLYLNNKQQLTKTIPNKKFKTLLKWTVKNLKDNI